VHLAGARWDQLVLESEFVAELLGRGLLDDEGVRPALDEEIAVAFGADDAAQLLPLDECDRIARLVELVGRG